MNFLLYVMALIILMASLSYSAFTNYAEGFRLRKEWLRYALENKTCSFNAVVKEEYKGAAKQAEGATPKTKDGSSNENAKRGGDAEGASVINFRYLIDKKWGIGHPKEQPLADLLLKRLIQFIYGPQPFFQKFLEERPSIVDELFEAVRQKYEDPEVQKLVKSVDKLPWIELPDGQLQEFWYELLRKNPLATSVEEALNSSKALACQEVSFSEYMHSLNKLKVRMYVAPRALLYALLQDSSAVDEVCKIRKQLYLLGRKNKNYASFTEEFKAFCLQFPEVSEFEPLLSFTVTGTNPELYE